MEVVGITVEFDHTLNSHRKTIKFVPDGLGHRLPGNPVTFQSKRGSIFIFTRKKLFL